jgi:hypothetical protein
MKPKHSQLKLWPRKQYGVSSVPGIREGYHFYEDGKLNSEGKIYYQFATAARTLGIPVSTIMYWAKKGVSSSGVAMNIYVHTNSRRMVPEETVLALRDSLQKQPKKSEIKTAPHP